MKLRTIIAGPIAVVAAGLLLSACGQASQVAGSAAISPAAASATAASSSPVGQAPTAAPAAVAQVGTFGQVLVGANGNTLYAFTKDVDGVSTCFDACAAAWPAVIVTPGFTPPAGVDPSLVTTVDRPDGSKQLKIGKWPLHFYAGDGGRGSRTGRASAASGSSRAPTARWSGVARPPPRLLPRRPLHRPRPRLLRPLQLRPRPILPLQWSPWRRSATWAR